MMPMPSIHKAICVFACRWCSFLGAERSGRERLPLPYGIRIMPVPCAGSVSVDSVVQAFANGAAGVAVLGCHLGGCRHNEANRDAHARLVVLADLLETMGIDRRRLCVSWGTAHEGAQYANLMNNFAQQLAQLPPLPDFYRIPENQAVALAAGEAAGCSGRLEHFTSEDKQDEDLRKQAVGALDKGRMVLGLARTECGITVELFTRKEDLSVLVAGPKYPLAKLAGTMLCERSSGAMQQAGTCRSLRELAFSLRERDLSVACRPCDARALRQMADLHRFSLEALDLIPIPCFEAQQKICGCSRPQWPSDKGASLPLEKKATVEDIIDWPLQLSRCVQCHWCRTACPVCICPACSLDDTATLPTGRMPHSSPLAYHLIRALHVADVCVQCGACQDACPQGIPLLRLHQAVASSLEDLGYRSGEGMLSPLRTARRKFDAPQWIDSLKGGKHA